MLWKGSQVPQEGKEEEAVTKKAITNINKYFTTFFYLFLFFNYFTLSLFFYTFLPTTFTHTHTHDFRAEKRSAQASAHPLSQAQGGLFCVLTVFDGVFVCHWESFGWDWMKCTRCERLLLEKSFYLCVVFLLRHLKITLDSEQPMLKQKRIIPSVWGGIKSFEHFQCKEASIFLIVHSIYFRT